jgi:hypothetical protein
MSRLLVEAPSEGPARSILDVRSWLKSGRGPDDGGERELGVEFREWNETVLASDGAKGLAALGVCAGEGGARPLPLPRILPPPSFRPDMSNG